MTENPIGDVDDLRAVLTAYQTVMEASTQSEHHVRMYELLDFETGRKLFAARNLKRRT